MTELTKAEIDALVLESLKYVLKDPETPRKMAEAVFKGYEEWKRQRRAIANYRL